ncbi:uroporphyrinogen decarboxylase family protein [Sedimentisphaera salicampi]|uniref:Methylcobalamin:coenzyme M methyltransferase n=1 Tax=Sedimentisphaera salicampi TaxID=1941349 RepID=A0A1W6LNB0_9BACT|nr:uroporphyrinogen decarboxylase family protein [Sedimentisphaera salicampi]ARN57232.1 methylcobalamin:coenzyme M methyltransferase [Sedimentisphaera salicampi]
MTGRERVLNAIRCKETDRIPWVPFVGSHAGALLGVGAEEYFKSAELISEGAQLAAERYKPDGLPVTFDLQIEAEVLGCDVKYSQDNPPAVFGHPLIKGKSLDDLWIPQKDEGRIKTVLQAAETIRQKNPDIALYATITGPFTLALHLLGTDIFMKMFEDVDWVKKLIAYCSEVAKKMSEYYIEAGCDVIALVDPMTSQIGPDMFKQFVSPYAADIFEFIRQKGAAGSFFVCGHAQQNIEAMRDCKPENISIDENISLEFVRQKCEGTQVSFGGNLQLTTVLLLGSEIDSAKDAVRCIDSGGKTGFILAPGCDLPYATPPENLEAVTKVVQDEYEQQIARNIPDESIKFEDISLPNYQDSQKVTVNVITLDSEACAPCQYMVDAVKTVCGKFGDKVEWQEHKIKTRDGLKVMAALGVQNIPTVCIDGEISFISRIPPKEELEEVISKKLQQKAECTG